LEVDLLEVAQASPPAICFDGRVLLDRLDDVMRASIRLALCAAALLSGRFAFADGGDNGGIRVDVVVDLTDAGKKVTRPTPEHPAYYYPVTRGYTEGGASLVGEKPPPPTADIQRMIFKALAQQGYLLMTKKSPPSLILMLWWGYKAPVFLGPGAQGQNGDGSDNSAGVPMSGRVSLAANHNEMEELVMGTKYEPDYWEYDGAHPSIRLEALTHASRVANYYMMVSALDFKSATQKKTVVLWTARVSTSRWSHTLDQVLPTLIATGAPLFGRDSDGPHIGTEPLVPIGHVIVGAPVLKTDAPVSAEPKSN
jgi:hypothetical protein